MTLKSTITKTPQSRPSKQDWIPSVAQEKALKMMMQQAGAGLFLSPGLGKSSCVLAAAKVFKKKKLIRKTLVVTPLRVCHLVWPAEEQKWKDFENLKVT